MDKKIIVVAGAIVVVGGGFIAHSMAGKAAEQQIQQGLAALEAEQDIAVSHVQTHKNWGNTSVTAHLEAVANPALGGELAMEVGYLSREADGSMTFSGDVLNGVVDFTTELGSGKRSYTFSADELTAAEHGLVFEQTEGSGYVDAEREHFALNMLTRHMGFADASGRVQVNGLTTELEHNIDEQGGEGRSHVRFAVDGVTLEVDDNGRQMEAVSLGGAEMYNTATLEGDTLSSRLYLSATDAVFMDSEPGRAELDITAEGLDYTAFKVVSEALERNLEDLDAEQALSAEQQQSLAHNLQATLIEQAHTLLAHSPSLHLNTFDMDATLPWFGRLDARLSGSLMFDGEDLPREATSVLLANINADMRRAVMQTQGRPSMSLGEAQAELAPRVSAELTVAQLPDALVAELPPAFQALLAKDEAPHTFAWESGQPLYNGEPLAKALAQ
ncbi:MAG: YdgA family protein [Halomonas sp.]|nr:DUF945 family protein [Halomonas sp.]MDN6315544.1 YdgA family protein [Halomonas sp.]